jgi:hypothetical protein
MAIDSVFVGRRTLMLPRRYSLQLRGPGERQFSIFERNIMRPRTNQTVGWFWDGIIFFLARDSILELTFLLF